MLEEPLIEQNIFKLKIRALAEESKQVIEYKMKLINSLILSLRDENDKLVSKSKKNFK